MSCGQAQRFAGVEIEPLLELFSEDYVHLDHRVTGWEPIRGREGVHRLVTAVGATTSDIRAEVDEVLAADDRVVAFRFRWVGHADQDAGGGEFCVDVGEVAVVEDGLIVHAEYFASDDRDAMLTRFAELSTT